MATKSAPAKSTKSTPAAKACCTGKTCAAPKAAPKAAPVKKSGK